MVLMPRPASASISVLFPDPGPPVITNRRSQLTASMFSPYPLISAAKLDGYFSFAQPASCSKPSPSVHSSSRGVHGKIATAVRFLDKSFCFSDFSFTRCRRSILFMRRSAVPRIGFSTHTSPFLGFAQRNTGHVYPGHVEL